MTEDATNGPPVAEGSSSLRSRLSHGDEIVDPVTWAGGIPTAKGITPRVRLGRQRWFVLLWLLPIGFGLLIVAVAAAKGLRHTEAVQDFITETRARWYLRGRVVVLASRSGRECSTFSTSS